MRLQKKAVRLPRKKNQWQSCQRESGCPRNSSQKWIRRDPRFHSRVPNRMSGVIPQPQHPRRAAPRSGTGPGESSGLRLGSCAAEIHGPVRFPRRAAICGEGLLPLGVVRIRREPVESDPDWRAIQAVVRVERSDSVLERAYDGHIDLVGRTGIKPPDGPLLASGFKGPQRDRAVRTFRQVQQIVLDVSKAAKHRPS